MSYVIARACHVALLNCRETEMPSGKRHNLMEYVIHLVATLLPSFIIILHIEFIMFLPQPEFLI
jgi:hypothetical protein